MLPSCKNLLFLYLIQKHNFSILILAQMLPRTRSVREFHFCVNGTAYLGLTLSFLILVVMFVHHDMCVKLSSLLFFENPPAPKLIFFGHKLIKIKIREKLHESMCQKLISSTEGDHTSVLLFAIIILATHCI
jgi:hypothetical protein